jgi:choline dehydrogenase-like flavoprotein
MEFLGVTILHFLGTIIIGKGMSMESVMQEE